MLLKGFVRNDQIRKSKFPFNVIDALLYNPACIGCRENGMLKEAYSMNTLFYPAEVLDTKKETQKESVSYEHAGYQIRVHFNGEKTLTQCIQNLTERKMAD